MIIRISALIFLAATFMSCNGKPDRPAPILDSARIQAANQSAVTLAGSAVSGIQHYYCANNCEGSGGDEAGTCPICGSEYVHNQAWHDSQSAPSPTVTMSGEDAAAGSAGTLPPAQAVPEPPQNSAGVWHYTCPSGHAGGAGSAVACSVCGVTLVHNTDYHN